MINHNPYPMPELGQLTDLSSFLYFVWEREAVRLAKENGHSSPYTKDEVIAKYRFCNIHRRDDRVTKWIIENLLVPYHLNDDIDLWFVAAIARYVNWPPALERLLYNGVIPSEAYQFDYKEFARVQDDASSAGEKTWGGAYMLFPTHKEPGQPKGYLIGRYILNPLTSALVVETMRDLTHNYPSVEKMVTYLSSHYGWSTFMAGQVASDLTYVGDMTKAIDLNTWAPIGPGSSLGLSFLTGSKETKKWDQEEFNTELMKSRDKIVNQLGIEDLNLHCVQNCFCEWGKYVKLRRGGKTKALYKPETRF